MLFNTIISYLFRIVNFIVFIGLMYYLFKKYLLGSIEDSMSEQEAYENGLKQQAGSFESRLHELKVEKESLKNHCALLTSKVTRWEQHFNLELEKREQEKEQLLLAINKNREKQNAFLSQHKLLEQTLPTALAQAQKSFEALFSDEKEQTQYLRSLIAKMSKE